MRTLFAALLLTVSSPALTQEAHPFVGTWRLISQQVLVEGESSQGVLGAHPKGHMIATREGRLIAVLTAEDRKAGMGDAERVALHKSMIAATGKYRIEGSNVVISIDASWNEAWNGTEQHRVIKVEGDKLTVDTAPAASVLHQGKTVVARLVFEREK